VAPEGDGVWRNRGGRRNGPPAATIPALTRSTRAAADTLGGRCSGGKGGRRVWRGRGGGRPEGEQEPTAQDEVGAFPLRALIPSDASTVKPGLFPRRGEIAPTKGLSPGAHHCRPLPFPSSLRRSAATRRSRASTRAACRRRFRSHAAAWGLELAASSITATASAFASPCRRCSACEPSTRGPWRCTWTSRWCRRRSRRR
jgi:hypothetical protein